MKNSFKDVRTSTSFILRRTKVFFFHTSKNCCTLLNKIKLEIQHNSRSFLFFVWSYLKCQQHVSPRTCKIINFLQNNQTTFCKLRTLKIKEVLNNTYLMTISLIQALNQQQILESKTKKTWSSFDLYNLCGLKCMTVYIFYEHLNELKILLHLHLFQETAGLHKQ